MSKLEEALLAQIAEAGLPAPKTEFRFAPPRRWKFDLSWDLYRLAVEVEGGIWTLGRHTRGKGYEADCEKYAEATLQGWRVIRVTGTMVADGRALNLIRRGLTSASLEKSWSARSLARGGPPSPPLRVGEIVVCLEEDGGDAPLLPMTVTEVDPRVGIKCSWFEDRDLCWRIYAPSQLRRAVKHHLP